MSNPFADAVAELEQEPQMQKGAQAPAPAMSSGNPFQDAAAQLESDEPAVTQPVKGGGTADNPFAAIVTFSEKIQQAREVGQAGFREASMGHAVMEGRFTLEEVEQQIAADDHTAQLSGDLEQYEKDSWNPWLTSVALTTARQLPMIEESLKPMLAGGLTGGGATAATGVGAAVAIPVGLATGTAATAGWAMDFISGQEYLNMRRRGVDHETAKNAATVSGFAQGMLQGIRFGAVGKLATDTAKNVLATHAKNIAHFIAEGGWFGFQQVALSEAQTATKLITEAIAGTVSKVPGAVPTMEEAAAEFAKTLDETIKGSIGLFMGTKAAGKVAGVGYKTLIKKAVDAHLKKQQAKIQKLEEKQLADQENEISGTENDADTADNAKEKEAKQAKRDYNKMRKGMIEREKLGKREAAEAEVNRIFLAAQAKFFIEVKETKAQETNRVQRLLKRMVNNSVHLDDGMKARLLGRIVEIDSVADLLKQGQKFIEDQRTREHANALQTANEKLEKAIGRGQQKGKKAALPAAAQQVLKWYDEFFTPPKKLKGMTSEDVRQQALQKASDYVRRGIVDEIRELQDMEDRLEKNELSEIFNQPADVIEKNRIAMQAQQYWGNALDAEAITKLAEDIEETVKNGKSAFLARKEAEATRLLANRAKVYNGIQGKKPVTPSTAKSAPKEMTGAGKLINSLRRTSSSLWDKLLQDTPFEERQKIIDEILDFTEAENKESAINIRAAEKLTELYTDAVGSMREVTRLIRDGANKKERVELKYTNAEGVTGLEKHTLNELVYLHMAMEDPGAIPGLVNGNKYTLKGMVEAGEVSTQEAIRQLLTEREGGKYLALAEAVKDFYRWFAPQIANHYLKEYGVKLPTDHNYSGKIFHRHIERIRGAADLLEDVHNFAQATLDPGSVKLRQNSKLPVRLVDPFAQVQRARAEMAFWIANSEKARELSFIFSDTSKDGMRDVIDHKLGTEFTGLVNGRLAWQYHLKPGIMDLADAPFQTLKSNMATGLLGGRLDQGPKQWTSILATLSRSNFAEFLDGLRGAMDKKRLQEYVAASELYRDRQDYIVHEVLEATKKRDFVDMVTGDRSLLLKKIGMIPMHKWGDGIGSAISGFIEFNRVRKAGGSVEEAALAGDRLVDQTQSSSRQSQKVPAEFKGGLANLSLAFAKEGIQAINRESGAIRDWLIHKDDKSLARMARVIVSIHATQVMFQAINVAPAFLFGEEKEQQEAQLRLLSTAIGGAYSNLPLLGWDVISGALSGFKGEQVPRTIVGGLVGDSTKLIKRLYSITKKMAEGEEVEGEDWAKAFKSMASVASVATGLPFWGAFKYTELGSKMVTKAQGEE